MLQELEKLPPRQLGSQEKLPPRQEKLSPDYPDTLAVSVHEAALGHAAEGDAMCREQLVLCAERVSVD